jgi:hypothetical protein
MPGGSNKLRDLVMKAIVHLVTEVLALLLPLHKWRNGRIIQIQIEYSRGEASGMK